MTFRIGDKVRNIYIMNLIGTISAVSMSYINTMNVRINTIDVHLNDDDRTLYECDPDNWELYFEVGDIVKHKSSGKVYRIYDYSSNDGFNLEHFSDAGNRYTKFYYVLPDDIRMANDTEKSEFYKLKESYETKEKEKLDLTPLKEYLKECLNKKYGWSEASFYDKEDRYMMEEFKIGDRVEHKNFGKGTVESLSSMKDHVNIVLDKNNESWSVLTSNLTKVKETKEMTSYKVGDIVDHVFYGKCTITSLEQFEEGYIDVFSEDRGGIVPVSISDLKKTTKYKVGDLVKHRLYNKSIIVDISEFEETGYIDIVPLEEMCRGEIKHVSIENLKKIDEFIINTDTYNELVDTIAKLKDENYELKDEIVNSKLRKDINTNALYYFGYKLPEVKSVLYHKPATIIFWKDGTKTVVKAQKKEKYDNEKGFVMAYLKKILGNEGNYYEEIKRWTDIQ